MTVDVFPPRSAHPVVVVAREPSEIPALDTFPVDSYDLENNPWTQHLLSRTTQTQCWRTYMAGCLPQDSLMRPFGFLRASPDGKTLVLVVPPFDYVAFLPLLQAMPKVGWFFLFHILVDLLHSIFASVQSNPSKGWLQHFEKYLASIPPYYIQVERCLCVFIHLFIHFFCLSQCARCCSSVSGHLQQRLCQSELIISSRSRRQRNFGSSRFIYFFRYFALAYSFSFRPQLLAKTEADKVMAAGDGRGVSPFF
jgi:hypothetical protein